MALLLIVVRLQITTKKVPRLHNATTVLHFRVSCQPVEPQPATLEDLDGHCVCFAEHDCVSLQGSLIRAAASDIYILRQHM